MYNCVTLHRRIISEPFLWQIPVFQIGGLCTERSPIRELIVITDLDPTLIYLKVLCHIVGWFVYLFHKSIPNLVCKAYNSYIFNSNNVDKSRFMFILHCAKLVALCYLVCWVQWIKINVHIHSAARQGTEIKIIQRIIPFLTSWICSLVEVLIVAHK